MVMAQRGKYVEVAGSSDAPKRSCCCRCCCCVVVVLVLLVAAVGGAYVVYGLAFGPFHAECSVGFRFQDHCEITRHRLESQIEAWGLNASCGNGSRCFYTLVSSTTDKLSATHLTYDSLYVDDLSFRFQANDSHGGCVAEGFSESRVWYALLDFGTNFCNLWNLVDGAGLNNGTYYEEKTSNRACTQYSSRNCDKY